MLELTPITEFTRIAQVALKKTAEAMRENIDIASEFIFLGLRMESGISLDQYKRQFGDDLKKKYADGLRDLADAGLINTSSDRLCLTRKGKLFSNEVFTVFV